MKNLKLELFEFKKKLDFETQEDVAKIVENHMEALNDNSEKRVIKSLNDRLSIHTYDKKVKSLLESLNQDLKNYELTYELKDLYRCVEARNAGGSVYRETLRTLLEIINLEDDRDRMSKIMNELVIHNWVPEIKLFLHNLNKNPEQRQNLLQEGSSESIFTIVEQVEEGYVAFIRDSWFLMKDDSIEKTVLENHVKDQDKLRTLRTLETSLKYSEVNEDMVKFKIGENLTIGLSVDNKDVFINEEKANKETTLESLFNSPIIPIVNKNFYPLLVEVSKNLDKFVELDVCKKVTNITNPFVEMFVFNYKDNMYMYRCDTRYANSLYKYESALELIGDVRNEIGYDLTYFFENKLDDEAKEKRYLEDKEREIRIALDELDDNAEKVEANIKMLGESKVLTKASKLIKAKRDKLEKELLAIKELQTKEVIQK